MTRQFPLWLVVASAALALAVSGCGSSSSTNISSTSGGAEQTTQTAAAATASASATPAVLAHLDPCTLITKADAQTVLGGVPAVNSDTGECVYDLSGSTFKRLAIQLGDKAVSADEFAAQANTLPGVCRTGGPSVSGAGDAAFESTDHTQLVVRKGARCFGLIVNPYDAAVRSTILTTILSRL